MRPVATGAVSRGLDLADFGTRVTAQDFDWVRRALGLERWNIYGESYGITVAITLMALYPGTVRSAVPDSLYPPDPVPLRSSTVSEARDAFFAHCAQDEACSTSLVYRAAWRIQFDSNSENDCAGRKKSTRLCGACRSGKIDDGRNKKTMGRLLRASPASHHT
jgi:pimeloyl-ACP methyl ester carboxylesterase